MSISLILNMLRS